MKKLAVLSLLTLSVFAIAGCSNSTIQSKFIESGFLVSADNSEINPWLSTAIKAEKEQDKIINFSVYAGYKKGFIDNWNSFETNPGFGKFALQRCIRGKSDVEISNSFFYLPNFNDESKYLVTYQDSNDGSDKILSRKFTYNFEDTFSLDDITIDQGYVCYLICLMDNENQVIEGNLFGGISMGSLYFIKSESKIMFSKYRSIFTE